LTITTATRVEKFLLDFAASVNYDAVMSRNFHLMVGIVGSGKSTYAKNLAVATNATLISSDDIRLEVCGDMTDQSKNGLIFTKIIPERIALGLAAGHVIYDATNYSRKARKDVCKQARELGAKVIAHVLQTPFEECYRRNAARRERVVPEFVLDKMVAGYEDVDTNLEKIDEVIKVNS
jgi:predicted kinase